MHCSGLYCISLHCIVSHVAVQSEYISVHFTGDVPSWPFVHFQPLFGAQTLLQGDVARFMQKLYRSFAHSQALDSWILDEIGNSMYILVTMSVVLIDLSGTGTRRKPLVELSRVLGALLVGRRMFGRPRNGITSLQSLDPHNYCDELTDRTSVLKSLKPQNYYNEMFGFLGIVTMPNDPCKFNNSTAATASKLQKNATFPRQCSSLQSGKVVATQ